MMDRYDRWHRDPSELEDAWRPRGGGYGGHPANDPGPRRGWRPAEPGYGWGGYGYPRPPTDEEVRIAVRRALFEDTWLDARDIDIRVERGVVTLSGVVKDYVEARYAWDDAWESVGVRGVISRLEVPNADRRKDEETERGSEPEDG